jgi:Peptidase family M23
VPLIRKIIRTTCIAASISACMWSLPTPASSAPAPYDGFQFPLDSWTQVGFGFGDNWTVGAQCPAGVWKRHTGIDVRAAAGTPVRAAANGTYIGVFTGQAATWGDAMLVSHAVPGIGTVISQYWHVRPVTGLIAGQAVSRGQVIAHVYDLGNNTHFHFGVWVGAQAAATWNGALPKSACGGSPAFPARFVAPTQWVKDHYTGQPPANPVVQRQMLINTAAAAYAKDSIGNGGWVQSTAAGDAQKIAVGGVRQMIVNAAGAAYLKDTLGSDGWIQETAAGDAKAIAVGSSGRQMIINACGAAYAKDAVGSSGWIRQTACSDAKRIAVGGWRIALINSCGAIYASDSLTSGLTQSTDCGTARAIKVGSSGRMLMINSCGAAYAEDQLGANWVQQTACGDAKAIAVGDQRIMLINSCGAVYAADALHSGLTQQTACGTATKISAGEGGIMMLINSCGAVYAKATLLPAGGGWTQETACSTAKAIATG